MALASIAASLRGSVREVANVPPPVAPHQKPQAKHSYKVFTPLPFYYYCLVLKCLTWSGFELVSRQRQEDDYGFLCLPNAPTFSIMVNRKAVLSPNSSHPFSDSIAPISRQWSSRDIFS